MLFIRGFSEKSLEVAHFILLTFRCLELHYLARPNCPGVWEMCPAMRQEEGKRESWSTALQSVPRQVRVESCDGFRVLLT